MTKGELFDDFIVSIYVFSSFHSDILLKTINSILNEVSQMFCTIYPWKRISVLLKEFQTLLGSCLCSTLDCDQLLFILTPSTTNTNTVTTRILTIQYKTSSGRNLCSVESEISNIYFKYFKYLYKKHELPHTKVNPYKRTIC